MPKNNTRDAPLMTRRTFLTIKACEEGYGLFLAIEAVSSTALAHPEWDLTEEKTYKEWEEEKGK